LKNAFAGKDQELVLVYESNPVRVHDLKYAGVDVATKLASLRKELGGAGATAIVITMLDEVAWLLNLVLSVYMS
jgi:Xaa-Pro aminopeptidase